MTNSASLPDETMFRSRTLVLAAVALGAAACLWLPACSNDDGTASGARSPTAGSGGALGEAGSSSLPSAGAPAAGAANAGGAGPGPRSSGYLHTEGTQIRNAANEPVRLTGISWFGFELDSYALHGLDKRSMGDLLDLVQTLGYNVLRIPYSNEFLAGMPPTGIDYGLNPDLMGLQGVELLDALIEAAGARGLRVILDRHRITAEGQSALWYTEAVPEEKFIADWVMLAERYKHDPTVIGADLHNEPHGTATWGSDVIETDWRLAAERVGNAILTVQPDWLIIVEGIQYAEGAGYWWGGNLRSAARAPVRLNVPGRLVYSAHDYPSTVSSQPWFSDPTYPANLPEVWRANWGYLVEEGIAPVWLGEFGTRYETESDQQWFQTMLAYLDQHQMSFAVWVLNNDSTATGGMVLEDWATVRTEKQDLISPLLAPMLE